LQEYLNRAADSQRWARMFWPDQKIRESEIQDDVFWGPFFAEIETRVRRIRDDVQDILDDNYEAPEAWKKYREALRDSREVFQECLDFLSGLAFRQQKLDEQVLALADELVKDCSRKVPYGYGPPMWTGPTSQDVLRMTFGRIIRVRFPEWTVWTLPYVAHEYGHIVSEIAYSTLARDQRGELGPSPIKQLLEQQISLLISEDAWVRGPSSPEEQKAEAKKLVEELFCDILAVYVHGPAYACAVLYLHLLPKLLPVPTGVAGMRAPCGSTEAKRALVILYTLETTTAKSYSGRLKQLIEKLRACWDQVWTEAATGPPPSDPQVKAAVDALQVPSPQGGASRADNLKTLQEFASKSPGARYYGELVRELTEISGQAPGTPREAAILEELSAHLQGKSPQLPYLKRLAQEVVHGSLTEPWRGYSYTTGSQASWWIVELWFDYWKDKFTSGRPPVEDVREWVGSNCPRGTGTLRDALNLAWLLRIELAPADGPNRLRWIGEIGRFTKDLCLALNERPSGEKSRSQQPPPPGPGE
jgi:hypothetical protein